MPEDQNPSTGDSSPSAPKEPKVRRISNKAPRKKSESVSEASLPQNDAAPLSPVDGEIATGAKPEQKRSNRRRRGKGKSSNPSADPSRFEVHPIAVESNTPLLAEGDTAPPVKADHVEKRDVREQPQHTQRPPQNPRRKPDPEKVAKNAWKIYLAEVSEEGVALIGDNDARELARRCFRLSEIFLEEEDRRN